MDAACATVRCASTEECIRGLCFTKTPPGAESDCANGLDDNGVDGADCADALELAVKLREYGFEDVTLYPGGYAEWTEYGGLVWKGDAP